MDIDYKSIYNSNFYKVETDFDFNISSFEIGIGNSIVPSDLFVGKNFNELFSSSLTLDGIKEKNSNIDTTLKLSDEFIITIRWNIFLMKDIIQFYGSKISKIEDSDDHKELFDNFMINNVKKKSLEFIVRNFIHRLNNYNTQLMLNIPILEEFWNDTEKLVKNFQEKTGEEYNIGELSFNELEKLVPELFVGINSWFPKINKHVSEISKFLNSEELSDSKKSECSLREMILEVLDFFDSYNFHIRKILVVDEFEDNLTFMGNYNLVKLSIINVIFEAYKNSGRIISKIEISIQGEKLLLNFFYRKVLSRNLERFNSNIVMYKHILKEHGFCLDVKDLENNVLNLELAIVKRCKVV